MNTNDRQSVAEYAKNARHWPIYFGSRISRKLPDVIRWLSDTHREHGCKFMVVDFLQLITLDRRVSTKNEELEIISNELQSFAIDKNLVLVVPSQVSRGPAQRDDKVPTIDDLRGSGGIGQSADVVIILHRKPLPSGWSGEVMEYDVRLAKNRNGATTTFVAGFMPRYVKFVDVDPNGF
jgi:replicative DNA helicase